MKAPTCHNCGAYAMHGLRFPGPLSEQRTRGYVWSCADKAFREAAEKRRNEAMKGIRDD